MSLSTDVLSRATPTRLYCRGGRWVLELTRLEAVDRDVFQPRLQRLEGSESILAMLRRSDEGQLLASGAAQLMRAARSDEDRAFEANEGDWVPSADVPTAGRHPQSHGHAAAPEGSDLALALTEMRAELMVLRASHSRLRDRVAALEASQSGLAHPSANARLGRGSRGRRRSEPPPGLTQAENVVAPLAENPGFAATQASPGVGPTPAGPLDLGAARTSAQPAAAVSARPAAAPAGPDSLGSGSLGEIARAMGTDERPPVLALPSLQALNECLGTLMDSAPALQVSPTAIELDELSRPQACKLLDDDGRERGIVILDLSAAVLLGAALLSLPREEALRQVKEGDPSEDALLATSEICNNLTGPINAVPGNHHVRSTALVSADVAALPRPRARLDMTVDGGRVVLAMF